MKISEYRRLYTQNIRFRLRRVWMEVVELLEELLHGRWSGVKEEAGDVVHMFQLYLCDRGFDGPLWMWCAKKFIARQPVWQALYTYVGLTKRACHGGNYNRKHKVVEHLVRQGVTAEKALEAYRVVIEGR